MIAVAVKAVGIKLRRLGICPASRKNTQINRLKSLKITRLINIINKVLSKFQRRFTRKSREKVLKIVVRNL